MRTDVFLPGLEAALDVAGRGKTGVLRRLHRHGRALAKGAVEREPLAGRFGALALLGSPTWRAHRSARASPCSMPTGGCSPATSGRARLACGGVQPRGARSPPAPCRAFFHDLSRRPCAPSEISAAQCEVLHTRKVADGIII